MDNMKDELWNKTLEFVESTLETTGVPGCSVGILQGGEIRSAGFGVSNIEKMSPVSADTVFQIGSISKTFTATLIMKLVEEGKLDVEQPVRTYLPDFKVADEAVSAAVTPRHLLTHSGGWEGDLFYETGDGDDSIPKYIQRLRDQEQIFALGKYFSYNNSGFTVLGGILEAVSQMRMEDLYRNNILEPLGMEQVYFNAGEAITYDFAVGHFTTPEGKVVVVRPWRMPRSILPMGGLVTNVGNLLKYAQCYLAGGKTPSGKQMLKPETIQRMFTPQVAMSEQDRTSRGYSWMRQDLDKGYIVGHGGGTKGQLTQLSLLPEHDFALAIFTNSDNGGKLIRQVHKFILKSYLDIEIDTPKAIEASPAELRAYAGSAVRPGTKIYLDMVGDHLVGVDESTVGFPTENDPPPPPEAPFRVGKCAADRLIILDGEGKDTAIDVFRDEAGKITHMRASRMYQFFPKQAG